MDSLPRNTLMNIASYPQCSPHWGADVRIALGKYESPIPYSCPSLVVPYSEELISRPFLGENRFWWVLQKRMSTENAVGCLFCLSRSLCLQLQQNTMVPVDVDGQICHFCSQGFVPWWQILVNNSEKSDQVTIHLNRNHGVLLKL